MVDVDGRVRMVDVGGRVRMVVVRAKEFPAAACSHAERRGAGGAFGVGVGGSDGGGLHEQGFAELSHCAAQLKKEQRTLAVAFPHPPRHEIGLSENHYVLFRFPTRFPREHECFVE
jgi:hypothetical protein